MKKSVLAVIGAAMTLAGCGNEAEVADDNSVQAEEVEYQMNPVTKSVAMSAGERAVVDAYNAFAWRLGSGETNGMLSPLSAAIDMVMAGAGATGATQKEIYDALGLGALNESDVASCCEKLVKDLAEADSHVDFTSCASLWAGRKLSVKGEYEKRLTEQFNSTTHAVNTSTFVDDINAWAADKTRGTVKEVLAKGEAAPSDQDLYIANAVYFKGGWNSRCAFSKSNTAKGTFASADGTKSEAEFMKNKASLRYLKSEAMEAAMLPFGGEMFEMCVILPGEGKGLDECRAVLAEGQWKAIAEESSERNVELRLPKLDIGVKADLSEWLKRLGIRKAFTAQAEFGGISEQSLTIASVKQATHMKIDETSAEASAVTVTTMVSAGIAGEKETDCVTMNLDRPFLLAIYEKSTGAIMFTGQVTGF